MPSVGYVWKGQADFVVYATEKDTWCTDLNLDQ